MLPYQCKECNTFINNDEGELCQSCINKTLNKREIAWQKRKQVKKESHPTYAQFGKYAGTLEQRMKKVKPLYAYTEERAAFEEEWYKKHGRAWYIFQGMTMRYNREKTWIEQYNVLDESRPRGKGIYKRREK